MVLKEANDDVVVFFDYENIVYSLRNSNRENPNFEILMDKCQEYGRVVIARAYANWSSHGTAIAPLQASGFDPVYVPTYFYESKGKKTRKNAVDIHIAIEAIEVMFTQPHINTFVLLTGDKDFIPLANALRRHGKTVVAIGVQGTTSPYMRQSSDDFVFYHQLLDDSTDLSSEPLQKDIYTVLVDAVKKINKEGHKSVFPRVKHKMSEIMGSFNEKDYTDSEGVAFTRFKDFIVEAQRLGYVKLVTTGSVNKVLLPDADDGHAVPEPAKQEKIDEATAALPEPPDAVSDTESAFELLVWAVNHAHAVSKSPRTASIKTIMRSIHKDFDEKQLPDEQGKNFAKFSDFTRAAEKRGLVRIEGKGIRMEIHPGDGIAIVDEPQSAPEDELVPIRAIETESEVELVPIQKIPPNESEAEEPAAPLEEIKKASQEPYVNDYRARVVVMDALRSCQYPAAAPVIANHCLDLSDKRNVNLPKRRLNQLLTTAKKMGLLQEAKGEGFSSNQFVFVETADLIAQFLDDET